MLSSSSEHHFRRRIIVVATQIDCSDWLRAAGFTSATSSPFASRTRTTQQLSAAELLPACGFCDACPITHAPLTTTYPSLSRKLN